MNRLKSFLFGCVLFVMGIVLLIPLIALWCSALFANSKGRLDIALCLVAAGVWYICKVEELVKRQ